MTASEYFDPPTEEDFRELCRWFSRPVSRRGPMAPLFLAVPAAAMTRLVQVGWVESVGHHFAVTPAGEEALQRGAW